MFRKVSAFLPKTLPKFQKTRFLKSPLSNFKPFFCFATPCSSSTQTTCSSVQTPCSKASNSIPTKKTEKGTAEFFVEQIFTGCLAEYSYYIDSEGEAAIIDPIYDINIYLELASQRGAKIKYIFETHFHADFVSGHIDLAKKTGATIVFGPLAKANIKFYLAKDQEVFKLGKAQIQLLHTPGHTLESSSLVLKDSNGVPHSIYTGDTLFLNEVGRPDLAANDTLHPEDMAKMLYDSIRNKIISLPDNVIIFPGHGAGSPCGKSIGQGDFATIGEQKLTNYAMVKDLSKEDFVKIASSNLPRPLGYMAHDVSMNKGGKQMRELEEIMKTCKKSYEECQKMLKNDPKIILLDSRDDISKGFLYDSYNVPLSTTFSIYVGTMLDSQSPLFVVSENDEKTKETIIRLLRVGYDNIVGYLEGGFETWLKNDGVLFPFQFIEAEKFKEVYENKDKNDVILDIRNKAEWEDGVLEGAVLVALRDLESEINLGHFEKYRNKKIFMHCRSGPRALTAYTLFKKYGYGNITNIIGGYNRMKELGFKMVKPDLK